ncbi:hypothetical protein O9993_09385 [Vibrio lentus]|nr:hypothetical protein [Vibrio lentus]
MTTISRTRIQNMNNELTGEKLIRHHWWNIRYRQNVSVQLRNEDNTVHIASRHTGVDIA